MWSCGKRNLIYDKKKKVFFQFLSFSFCQKKSFSILYCFQFFLMPRNKGKMHTSLKNYAPFFNNKKIHHMFYFWKIVKSSHKFWFDTHFLQLKKTIFEFFRPSRPNKTIWVTLKPGIHLEMAKSGGKREFFYKKFYYPSPFEIRKRPRTKSEAYKKIFLKKRNTLGVFQTRSFSLKFQRGSGPEFSHAFD